MMMLAPIHYSSAMIITSTAQVYCTLEKMKVTGVDCLLDCHADETLPYAFLAGIEGDARWGSRGMQNMGHINLRCITHHPPV